ncbi:MAG: hypothetical protein EOP33_01980 [Rickettsiaceae bacterium]|nr:MAG: hypothetical protein EOP33_01980 [Rickettsiaceae bacterium]
MVKTKCLVIIFFLTTPFKIFAASAWLPVKQKYSISLLNADKASEIAKNERIKIYQLIESIVGEKYNKQLRLEEKKQRLIYVLSLLDKVGSTNAAQDIMRIARRKANIRRELHHIESVEQRLSNEIHYLESLLLELHNYNQEQFLSAALEHRINDDSSLGISWSYIQNKFTNSKYNSAERISTMKSFELFYKYKILERQNFILSTQLQLLLPDHLNLDDKSVEIFLLIGNSKQQRYRQDFTDISISCHRNIIK